jgi:esterase
VTGDAPYEDFVLFLRGGNSPYIQLPEDEPAIRAHFPQFRIETVVGAGHWVHAEAPQEVVKQLKSLLNA